MDISSLNLVAPLTLTAITAICYVITQGIKQSALNNKYMPFISMIIGIIAGIVAGVILKEPNMGNCALVGFYVGSATAGLFTGFKGVSGGYNTNVPKEKETLSEGQNSNSEWEPTEEQTQPRKESGNV